MEFIWICIWLAVIVAIGGIMLTIGMTIIGLVIGGIGALFEWIIGLFRK
jgi:hypothetical protein